MRLIRTASFHVFGGTVVLILVVITSLFGATRMAVSEILEAGVVRDTWLYLRLPRTLFSFFAGAGLAMCGAAYQSMFRNPLASPFSLGISAGASLGAALAVIAGSGYFLFGFSQTAAAIVGAGLAFVFILKVGVGRRGYDNGFLLLAGVALSLFCGSLITLIQYLSDYSQLFRVTRWMIGGVVSVSYLELLWLAGVVLFLLIQLTSKARDLDLLLFGTDFASSKGVDVPAAHRQIFFTTSLFVGLLVALCGVIGFVGIIVPAIVRLRCGVSHSRVIPVSFYFGGLLVMVCDLIGRTVAPPYEIPVGVFTALIGGPVFIWLLVRSRGGV